MGIFAGWNRKASPMSHGDSPQKSAPASSFAIWAASTILVSAFLLFQVQPVISKMILPWFGGSSAVWSTCMLFFQMVLLAGYGYAHWLSRSFSPRRQVMIHVGLMVLALATLPITPSDYWRPDDGSRPSLRILLVLLRHVGLPYFLLSTTGPLVQAWFGRVYEGKSPYRLYALSNIGSLTALLSYPFVFEPMLTSSQQDWCWSIGFGVFAALNAVLAWHLWRYADHAGSSKWDKAVPCPTEDHAESMPKAETKLLWVLLPFLASVALLAVTNHLSQDVAAVPFLWVVPLSLYLLSFIICFDHDRWYQRWFFATGALLSILWICVIEAAPALDKHATRMGWPATPSETIDSAVNVIVKALNYVPGVKLERFKTEQFDYNPLFQGLFYLASLFFGCMVCHGELSRLKPSRKYLTDYFLMISAGGALGGVFVALMCPVLFVWYAELPLAQAGIFLVAGITLGLMLFPKMKGNHPTNKWLRFGLCAVALAGLGTMSGNAAMKHVENATIRAIVPLVLAFLGAGLAYGIVATSRRELQVMCSAIAGLLMLAGLFGLVLGNTIRVQDKAIVAAKRSFYGALQVKDDSIATMLLDGKSEVRIKASSPVIRADDSFTIEFWFKRSETESPLVGMMQLGQLGIALGTRKEGELPIAFCQVGNSRTPEQEWSLADDDWHHFNVSGDGTAIRIHIDGQPLHSVTLADLEVSKLSPVALGMCRLDGTTRLAGEMHSLRVTDVVVHSKARPFAPPAFADTRLPDGAGIGLRRRAGRQHRRRTLAPPRPDSARVSAHGPHALQGSAGEPAGGTAAASLPAHHLLRGRERNWPGHPPPSAGRQAEDRRDRIGRGTTAAFGHPGETIRFYEIDQTVVDLSADYFTYRSDSLAEVTVALGDARIQLEREAPQGYDVIAVDAFSGDAIPVHLLTRECLQVYLKHLRRNGILAIHISNRYLDLAPIVRALAQRAEMRVENFHYAAEKSPVMDTQSEWMLLTKNSAFFDDEEVQAAITPPRDQRVIEWTDQYSNLRDILQ